MLDCFDSERSIEEIEDPAVAELIVDLYSRIKDLQKEIYDLKAKVNEESFFSDEPGSNR